MEYVPTIPENLGLYRQEADEQSFVPSRLLHKNPERNKEGWEAAAGVPFAVGSEVLLEEMKEHWVRQRGDEARAGIFPNVVYSDFKRELLKGKKVALKQGSIFQTNRERLRTHETLATTTDVAVAYLGTLLREVLSTLQATQGFEDARYKVYLSEPAREVEGDEDKASQVYRGWFTREVANPIQEGLQALGFDAQFAGSGDRYLLEPYGVFYYVQRKLELQGKLRGDYLVIDVGGATTDLALLRVTEEGQPALSSHSSIDHAGNDYDTILLKHVEVLEGPAIGEDAANTLAGRASAMAAIRAAKEEVSTAGHDVEVQITTARTVRVTPAALAAAFGEWWPKVDEALVGLLAKGVAGREPGTAPVSQFRYVILAGGSAQLCAHGENLLRVHLEEAMTRPESPFPAANDFVLPADLGTHASVMTALGQALDIRGDTLAKQHGGQRAGAIERGEYVQGQLRAVVADGTAHAVKLLREPKRYEDGSRLRFPYSHDGISYLAHRNELAGALRSRTNGQSWETTWEDFGPVDSLPENTTRLEPPREDRCHGGVGASRYGALRHPASETVQERVLL